MTDTLPVDSVSGRTAQSDAEFRRDAASGEALRAQSRTRVGTVITVASLQVAMLWLSPGNADRASRSLAVAALASAYVMLLSGVHVLLLRRRRTTPEYITAVLLMDLACVFSLTAVATNPSHYERALFGAVVIVHVANFYFGRRQAWRTVVAGAAGFLLLLGIAVARGLQVDVAEELWTLALCVAASSLMVLQTTDVRRRLRTIVNLFEHAEEGDFAHTYDVDADRRPDAITRVGRAYNGVRKQLANMVLTDPLTGCLNRRGFDQALAREAARASRAQSSFALLALDLDHFKEVNDTWGHMAGDEVLRNVGTLLLAAGRAQDVVARVGGEEFAILLSDNNEAGAHLFASRLCDLVRTHPFVISGDGTTVAITTSIGVVSGAPRGVDNFAAILWSRADAALYQAKRAGRNCVRVWRAGLSTTGDHAVYSPTVHHAVVTMGR